MGWFGTDILVSKMITKRPALFQRLVNAKNLAEIGQDGLSKNMLNNGKQGVEEQNKSCRLSKRMHYNIKNTVVFPYQLSFSQLLQPLRSSASRLLWCINPLDFLFSNDQKKRQRRRKKKSLKADKGLLFPHQTVYFPLSCLVILYNDTRLSDLMVNIRRKLHTITPHPLHPGPL